MVENDPPKSLKERLRERAAHNGTAVADPPPAKPIEPIPQTGSLKDRLRARAQAQAPEAPQQVPFAGAPSAGSALPSTSGGGSGTATSSAPGPELDSFGDGIATPANMQRVRRAEGYALAAEAPVAEASTTATVAPVADAIDRQQSLLNTQAAPQEKTFLNAVKFDQFDDAIYSEGAAAQNLQQPGTNHLFTAHDKVLADYRKAVEMGLAEQIAVPVITEQTEDPNQFRAEAAQEAMFTNNMAAYMHQQKVLNARANALAIAQQQGIPPEQIEAYEQERQDIIEGNKFIQQQTKDMVRKYPLFAQKVAELQAAQDQADAERAQAPIMGGIKQTITGPIVKTIHGFGANMARFAGGLNGDDASFFDELGREMQRVNEVYTKEITPRSMEGPVIDTEKDAEGNEKQVIRGDRLLAASTGAITQAALLYATGGGAGVPAGAQRALMGGQAFVQSYPDYYDAAKRAGLSDSQAVLNATLNSGGQAMSESIFPEKYFPDGVSRSYKKAAIDVLQGKGTTWEAVKQMTLGIGKQGAKEGAEEVAALLGERGVNAVTNKLLGSELEDEVTTNEVLEAGLLGVIAGSTLTGVGQLRTNPLRAAAIDWAVSNEAEFNAALDRQQGMTPEDKTKVKEKLAEIKAVRAGIPGVEQMSPDDRAKITDAVRAKNEVKNSGVVVDDAVAAATGDPVQARIAAYNDVIESMVGKPPPEKTADGKVKEPTPISPAQQKLNDAVKKELGLTGEAAPQTAAVPQPDAAPRGVDTGGQADAKPQVTPARITELAQKFIDAEQNGTILEEEDMDAISNNAQAVEAEVVKLREPKKVVTSPDLTKDIPDDENAIVDAYYDEHLQWNSEANPDYVIFNALAKSVKPSSFDQFGDANKRSSSIAKTYFAKAGDPRAKGLDQIAQEVSGMLGTEVTPDELVSFMESYQNGLPRRSPRMAEMNDRYQQITGKKLDAGIAARIIAKKGKSSAKDPEVQEFIEGFTDEEGNVNWQAVKNNIKALSFLGYTDEQAARIEAEADRQLAVSGGAEVLDPVRKDEGDTGQGGKSQNGSGEVAAQRPAQRQAAAGRPNLDRMLNALRDIAPGITITIHDTAGGFAAGTKGIAEGIASSWGVYDPRTNSIHINAGTATDIRQTAFHEAAHPLLIALAKNNPEAFMSFHEEVMSHPDAQKYRDHASNYADQSEAQQMAEALAEFLGDVAAGRVDVSAKPDSLWRRAMDWIKDVLAKLGWDVRSVDLSKPQTLKEFAFQFKKAMQKGIRINGFEPVGGGAPSLQDDADRLVDGWYSRLDQAVAAKGNTQSGADWMKWAEARAKEGLLSMEEVRWTGLADFLQGKSKATPKEVREFLKENRVKVEVVELNDGGFVHKSSWSAEPRLPGKWEVYDHTGASVMRNVAADTADEAVSIAWEEYPDDAKMPGNTKFSQYQLPGGTNYREVLVTLPQRNIADDAAGKRLYETFKRKGGDPPWDELTQQQRDAIIADTPSFARKEDAKFRSSHFDEPNILVHLRLNDRTGPNGEKVLFIEELQSDWGQQGKKKGFGVLGDPKTHDEIKVGHDLRGWGPITDIRTTDGVREFRIGSTDFWLKPEQVDISKVKATDLHGDGKGVPSAPFVTSTDAWVELGLKQAIRMAVEGGPSPAWADATKPKSIREEFDNHLSPELASVLPLEVVNASVLAASKNDEVRRAIVAAIPVDVVNILSKHGVSPESLLTKSDVFGKSIPVVSRPAVARGLADALQLVGARLRATLDGELSLEPTRSNGKPLAAVSARDFSPDVVVGLLSPSRIYGSKELGRDMPLAAASRTGSGAEAPGAKTAKVKLAGESRELGSAELAVALNRHDAILRNSADNSKKYDPGYEVISWTTGTQQNERYDLSKQVDRIEWVKYDEDVVNPNSADRNVAIELPDNSTISLDVDTDGKILRGPSGFDGKRLDEVVGKDIADKIMSEEEGDLSDDGLKVGGSGMKGFYDKILPAVAKKVSKKLVGDGAVAETEIDIGGNTTAAAAVQVYKVAGHPSPWWVKDSSGEVRGRYATHEEAKQKQAELTAEKMRSKGSSQQSISITPAMRERVGLGVPLMQYSDQQKAAIQKLINTKAYKSASFADKIRMQKEVADAVKSKKKPASLSSTQQPSAPNEVKKTIATKRAYEGEFRSEVKKELERLGLTREIESRETARKNAQALIDSVGIAAALDAVRNNDVPGGAGAYVWATAIKEIDKMMLEAKDQQTIDALAAKQAELVQELSSEALSKGRFNSALDDVYQNSDLGWSAAKKTEEWKKEFGEEPPAEVMERWRARDKEFADLKAKLAEAEARAQEAEENAIIKAIQRSIAKEKAAPIRKRAANPKTLASKIRGLKIGKPGVMSSFIIPPQLFDTAIEVVATAVEAGEAIASAIAKGLRALRDSDWYKGVDADVQAQADEEFSSKMSGLDDEDMVGGPLRLPKSIIRAAVENGASNIQELVAAIKDQIADTYPDATDREVRDAITDYGRVLNMSRDQISIDLRKMRRIGRLISQLEDVREKKRPLRSGLQRDKMDAEERALNKELREAMKALPPDPGMLEREFATALDAAKTRARNRIEDLQREIDTRTRANKTASRVQPDEELIELQKQRDALQEEHDGIFVDRTASMEERVARAVESARRSLEDLERRIAEKDVTPKKSEPLKETPELTAIRAQRDAARQEYKTLQEQAGVFEARRLAAAKAAARARIDELDRRLENGDFSKKEVKSVAEDTELQALRVVRMRLQEEYDKEFHRKRLETRTTSEKVKDAMWEAWGLTRALSATAEMSFVLMQGGALTISNAWRKPGAVARAFKNTFRAMGSERKSEEWLRKIKTQDWYPAAKEAGLAITEPHAELTAREELFVSDWTRIIWNVIGAPSRAFGKSAYEKWKAANPFRAVERGAVSYLDTLRAERFIDGLAMLEARKADGKEVTKQDYKDVADAINTLTGRGSLGKAEPIAKGLAKVFFSPRLWSSTIKTATPYALYHFGLIPVPTKNQETGKWKVGHMGGISPTARKLALQDLGRFVGTTMGFVALAALYLNNDDDEETGVETDPRSSDFGKIKIGDTRIDPWGGRIQQVVFSTRMILGAMSLFKDEPIDAYKKTSGELSPLGANNAPTMFDTGIRMATNKLAPSASLAAEAMMTRVNKDGQRKTNFGEDFSLASEAGERLMPIYAGTVKDLMDEDPGTLEGFLMFYSFFGGGVQEYDNDKEKKGR